MSSEAKYWLGLTYHFTVSISDYLKKIVCCGCNNAPIFKYISIPWIHTHMCTYGRQKERKNMINELLVTVIVLYSVCIRIQQKDFYNCIS